MRKLNLHYVITFIGVILSVISVFVIKDYMHKIVLKKAANTVSSNIDLKRHIIDNRVEEKASQEILEDNIIFSDKEEPKEETESSDKYEPSNNIPVITTKPVIIEPLYKGLSKTELTNKLNNNLYDKLEGTGSYFTDYFINTGLDPYLSVAIVLHETGCKWGCSKIARECNNFGGIKGNPSCNGGSYKRYETLEEGINGYLDVVFNNYYNKGLTTPELMNPKYAASSSWADAINNYINALENN